MQWNHRIVAAVAATSLAVAATFVAPALGPAGAATPAATAPPGLTRARQALEHQLTIRLDQLKELSNDVTGSSTLSTSDAGTLASRLANATTSISGLLTAAPADNRAALRKARRTMIYGNRVFAVLTPQVYEVIGADATAAQVRTMTANEAALQQEVSSLVGQVGYHSARVHLEAYVATVNRAAGEAADVASTVLAQVPAGFPRDRNVFVRANRQLLAADEALDHAAYDQSLVALAAGGYTGS